ncbi:MAG: hypothetical protein JSV76_04260 [Candidatus Bathyarchaeota archaeon]|nr:MAG: hypothetical protein JSV76_04260 [Candidatus Bathyarchaeota archaeon]
MKYQTLGIILIAICIASGVGYLAANALTSTLHVYIQLLPESIGPGDTLTIGVNVTDIVGTPIDGAEVTATIGDLEIIYILTQHGNGHYRVTIDTPIMTPGTYDVTVSVQKERYHRVRTSTQLVISVVD